MSVITISSESGEGEDGQRMGGGTSGHGRAVSRMRTNQTTHISTITHQIVQERSTSGRFLCSFFLFIFRSKDHF